MAVRERFARRPRPWPRRPGSEGGDAYLRVSAAARSALSMRFNRCDSRHTRQREAESEAGGGRRLTLQAEPDAEDDAVRHRVVVGREGELDRRLDRESVVEEDETQ